MITYFKTLRNFEKYIENIMEIKKRTNGKVKERICSFVRLILLLDSFDCEYSNPHVKNIVKAIKNEVENNPSSGLVDFPSKIDVVVLKDFLEIEQTIKDSIKSENRIRNLISGTVRQNVLMRDNYTCQICGATVKDGAKLEIDHIIPVSKGGTNDENNLQVLCQQCNREKHNRTDLLHDKLKLIELEGK